MFRPSSPPSSLLFVAVVALCLAGAEEVHAEVEFLRALALDFPLPFEERWGPSLAMSDRVADLKEQEKMFQRTIQWPLEYLLRSLESIQELEGRISQTERRHLESYR